LSLYTTSFSFNVTAPSVPRRHKIRAIGNAVNFDTFPEEDNWNQSDDFEIEAVEYSESHLTINNTELNCLYILLGEGKTVVFNNDFENKTLESIFFYIRLCRSRCNLERRNFYRITYVCLTRTVIPE